MRAMPGDTCPRTGVWTPADNATFLSKEYADLVMRRQFSEGESMPPTPHGEPYWIFSDDQGEKLLNFTGMSPDQIVAALKDRDRKQGE